MTCFRLLFSLGGGCNYKSDVVSFCLGTERRYGELSKRVGFRLERLFVWALTHGTAVVGLPTINENSSAILGSPAVELGPPVFSDSDAIEGLSR